jgi:hypothetical protein
MPCGTFEPSRRAVEWLLDQGLIDAQAARQFARDHPDPDLP